MYVIIMYVNIMTLYFWRFHIFSSQTFSESFRKYMIMGIWFMIDEYLVVIVTTSDPRIVIKSLSTICDRT